jgi:hypothetical protein
VKRWYYRIDTNTLQTSAFPASAFAPYYINITRTVVINAIDELDAYMQAQRWLAAQAAAEQEKEQAR